MPLAAVMLAGLIGLSGCSNPCEELADRICDRATEDLNGCDALQEGSEQAEACARMNGVVLSCRQLRETAETAGPDDEASCKANLELIRALERQQER